MPDQYESYQPDDDQGEATPEVELSDDDLLSLVKQERVASLGFDQDSVLTYARTKALDYYKGEMPDVPALPNRSKAVSTDVADAVETLLPDLIEIFTGGEDIATFQPVGQEDEEAARQETDYVNHVVMNENDGFMTLYSAFKDALVGKVGIFKWWWEESEGEQEETFTGKAPQELQEAQAWAQANGWAIEDLVQDEAEPLDLNGLQQPADPTFSYTMTRRAQGKLCVSAVPPEDFSVARDTVSLKDTTYCAMRSRPRAQDLIAQGYDRDAVEALPPHGTPSSTDAEALARDTAGENATVSAGSVTGQLHTVEITEHFIRVVNEQGEAELWRVVTGNNESSLLEREKVDQIQFAAVTPYPVPHRFFGQSVADLLMEVQRIKTALQRMLLDSGYFALNQRLEVGTDQATQFTISDLLRNEPGVPIRTKNGQAIRAIGGAGLSFDAMGALEYFSTVGEARTGIVRNAQGLNPDTLHSTASGALALMSAASRRMRMIARIFAETGVKDMFLGVHAMLRRYGTMQPVVRLRGQWVQNVDPTQWGERKDMTIEIGIGSGGQAHEMQMMTAALPVMTQLIQEQGGFNGPFVTQQNAYNFLKRYFERGLGMKSADPILSDPSKAPPQQPAPPAPDPAMAKVQADAAAAQQKQALDHQLAQQKLDNDLTLEREKMAQDVQLQREKGAADMQLKREQMHLEASLKAVNSITTPAPHPAPTVNGPHFGGAVG